MCNPKPTLPRVITENAFSTKKHPIIIDGNYKQQHVCQKNLSLLPGIDYDFVIFTIKPSQYQT